MAASRPTRTSTTTIAWHLPGFLGAEWCEVQRGPQGTRIHGVALVPEDGPNRIDYAIELDAGDLTRAVHVAAETPTGLVEIELSGDGAGTWHRGNEKVLVMPGAVDVDLGFSPVTNSLPIWRLDLPVGTAHVIDVLWIKFPGFELIHAKQTYRRLAFDRYRYSSGKFAAEMRVGADGLVEEYAEWVAVGRVVREA